MPACFFMLKVQLCLYSPTISQPSDRCGCSVPLESLKSDHVTLVAILLQFVRQMDQSMA